MVMIVLGALPPSRASAAPRCGTDADCPGDAVCVSRRCVAPRANPSSLQCARDVDCPDSDVCERGRCVAPSGTPAAPAPPTPQPPFGPCQVIVVSAPPGATVLVDGTVMGTSPVRILVPPGPHRVELELRGYEPEFQDAAFAPGGALQLSFELRLTAEETQRRAEAVQRQAEAEARAQDLARQRAEAEAQYRFALGVWEHDTAPARAVRQRDTVLGGVATGAGAAMGIAAAVLCAVGGSRGAEAYGLYTTATDPALFRWYREDIQAARNLLLAGGIVGGVGLVALVVGVRLLGGRPDVPAPPAAPIITLAPIAGGAAIALGGGF
jgi:hypothetical protein